LRNKARATSAVIIPCFAGDAAIAGFRFAKTAWIKMFGECPATVLPGFALIVVNKTDLETNRDLPEKSLTDYAGKASESLRLIRRRKPLIHNVTNLVVMNTVANVLLAIGASPVMAYAAEEVEDVVSHAKALVLNTGTLSPDWAKGMLKAARKAMALNIPVILDPVGVGATQFRTDTTKQILDTVHIKVIKGNASEILSLASRSISSKGVDSMHPVEQAVAGGQRLACDYAATIAITGVTDIVIDPNRAIRINNGHELMSYVTGMGCAASALIGAFISVDPDPFSATVSALCTLATAGEMAGDSAKGPGSFEKNLLDALYCLTPERVKQQSSIENMGAR
jgi:hydroxyethylthiazole kinase